MKKIVAVAVLVFIFPSCKKGDKTETPQVAICTTPLSCDIQQVYAANTAKVTVTNGIWGTVSSMEGNCMPVIGPGSTCKHCPVKRTVKIYTYTTTANAVLSAGLSGFYDSFNTTLVKQVDTGNEGFFQTDLPAGNYTLVIIENGKLFGNNSTDGSTGINPFTHTSGQQKVDFRMLYKAVF